MILEREKPDAKQRLLEWLAALFVILVFAFMIFAVFIAYQITVAIPQLQDNSNRIVIVVENQSAALVGLEAGLMREAIGTRSDLVRSHKDAMDQLAGGMKLGFGTLNYQIAIAQGVLQEEIHGHLERLNDSADTVAGPAGQAFSQMSEAASLSLDCDHNADCLHNRTVGTLRSVEKMANAGAEAAPAIPRLAESFARTAESTASISESCPFLRKIFLGCKARK
jgi:hypothetical protein